MRTGQGWKLERMTSAISDSREPPAPAAVLGKPLLIQMSRSGFCQRNTFPSVRGYKYDKKSKQTQKLSRRVTCDLRPSTESSSLDSS